MNPGDEIRKGNKMSELDFSGKIFVVTGTNVYADGGYHIQK